MSSGTFPSEAVKPYLGKKVKWVIALDNDSTGRRCLKKHAERLRDMKEEVLAAISSEQDEKQDWNDLHKAGKLTEDDMRHYRHLGKLELAKSAYEKARYMWENDRKKLFFVFTFANKTYSFSLDPTEYEKAHVREHENDPLKADKAAFGHASKINEIATFAMDFLYFQKPQNGEEGQYFFQLSFGNHADAEQIALSGKVLAGSGDFKKAVGVQNPSALFEGKTQHLDFLRKKWMEHIPKIVTTLDFIGYDPSTGAYVYQDYAVENGKLLNLNKESFFQLRKSGIKTTVDIKQRLNNKIIADWLPDYQKAFGTGGMVALSWWFGSLFVEQVRQQYRSYPFFEIIGEAGSGKSDMVDFLWKLLGREGESFNPNASTLAGRTRKMAEVSNLPVVFNETDNEKIAEDRHVKQFAWDELKDLFDGEFGRVTGQKTQDNATRKPTFKASLMAVQNIPVIASEAIMSRFMHLQFDRSHHSMEGKYASDRLNMLPVMDVSGFLLHSVQRSEAVLKKFAEQFDKHRVTLQANPKIKMQRITENHAKIMAFADCLSLVLPISAVSIVEIHRALIAMAENRQETLNEEHPIVQQFWSLYDYANSRSMRSAEELQYFEDNLLNHSMDTDTEIAINLEHFRQRCAELKLELMDTKELRRHLPTSRKRKYLRTEAMYSRLEKRTVRCWIFKR